MNPRFDRLKDNWQLKLLALVLGTLLWSYVYFTNAVTRFLP
jgi:hypothetical protein